MEFLNSATNKKFQEVLHQVVDVADKLTAGFVLSLFISYATTKMIINKDNTYYTYVSVKIGRNLAERQLCVKRTLIVANHSIKIIRALIVNS